MAGGEEEEVGEELETKREGGGEEEEEEEEETIATWRHMAQARKLRREEADQGIDGTSRERKRRRLHGVSSGASEAGMEM